MIGIIFFLTQRFTDLWNEGDQVTLFLPLQPHQIKSFDFCSPPSSYLLLLMTQATKHTNRQTDNIFAKIQDYRYVIHLYGTKNLYPTLTFFSCFSIFIAKLIGDCSILSAPFSFYQEQVKIRDICRSILSLFVVRFSRMNRILLEWVELRWQLRTKFWNTEVSIKMCAGRIKTAQRGTGGMYICKETE